MKGRTVISRRGADGGEKAHFSAVSETLNAVLVELTVFLATVDGVRVT
jgi:hypothetical protein